MPKTVKELHVAILFHRIGPYHFARIKASASYFKVTAVESSNVDSVYKWDLVTGAERFDRVTLFSDSDVEKLPAQGIEKRVAEALGALRPDVVAIPGWSDRCSLAALQWCATHRVPAVVMSDSTVWDEKRVWLKEWIKKRVVTLCATGFVAGQPHAEYLEQLGMEPSRVFLGYDVVDNDYFADKAREARGKGVEVRSKAGLPETYFLASSRFVAKKNLLRLLQAYARYRERARAGQASSSSIWPLVLIGDGELKTEICRQIADLGLQDSVILPGFKQYQDLPTYYAFAGAFVHASTTEQWGLVVNEAMASGLPVLVSDRCGCARDLVQEGKNGFAFDPLNVEQLAELMSKVAASGFPLSKFGAESENIISAWGVNRFAGALSQAASRAVESPARKMTFLDRSLLQILLRR